MNVRVGALVVLGLCSAPFVRASTSLDGMTFAVTPVNTETWKQVLSRAYEGTPISPAEALPLLILSNRPRFSTPVRLEDRPRGTEPVLLPSPALVDRPRAFLDELRRRLLSEFSERLATAGFKELERRYVLLNDILLPLFQDDADLERAQLSFDFRMITAFKQINDGLFILRNHRPHDIDLAERVRRAIVATENDMAAGVADPDILVREELQRRLTAYRLRYAAFLDHEVTRRLQELAAHLFTKRVATGRQILHTLLLRIFPLMEGVFHPDSMATVATYLGRAHDDYVAPLTFERSLAFTMHFDRIVSLLAPPNQQVNYEMGYKISDQQFASLVTTPAAVAIKTDCSGFIGRVYRELARLAGLDLEGFVVGCSGAISTYAMIEPGCAQKVTLAGGTNPLVNLRQGDFFYFEVNVRGTRDRHVCVFDRMMYQQGGHRLSMWEACPRGVKQTIRPLGWILKHITNPYGAPRAGAYRFNDMSNIDGLLRAKGLPLR